MPRINIAGDKASCFSHAATGSCNVFINGYRVSRINIDTAGGLIVGPGCPTIFAEGSQISLDGDLVATHGLPPHTTVVLSNPINIPHKVSAGKGFSVFSNQEGDQETYDATSVPSPNIATISFAPSLSVINTSGQATYPPQNIIDAWCECNKNANGQCLPYPPGLSVPFLSFTYSFINSGQDKANPFTIGIFKFPTDLEGGFPSNQKPILTIPALNAAYTNPEISNFYSKITLIHEELVPGLNPGETYTGSFVFPEYLLLDDIGYNFAIYADIYQDVSEPNENNSFSIVNVKLSDSC